MSDSGQEIPVHSFHKIFTAIILKKKKNGGISMHHMDYSRVYRPPPPPPPSFLKVYVFLTVYLLL